MSTPNPWDIPPRPENGDASEEFIFASVGYALTRWEILESWLARLYAITINVRGWEVPAERAFGIVATSRTRVDMISEAAAAVFLEFPDAEAQARLRRFLTTVGNYAGRRNDIAHGVVMPYRGAMAPFDGYGTGFVLAPARYMTRKQELHHHSLLVPAYIYSSVQINYFGDRFTELATEAEQIRSLMSGVRRSQPGDDCDAE
jgi:hypothetical protein